jgi:ketosteroid isomerase-like protein
MAGRFSPEELADRAAIQDVIIRYANALDRRDYEGVASCFTPGATAVYGGVRLEPGVDGIVRFLKQLRPGTEERHPGTHLAANLLITLEGDEARAESYVIAYSVPPEEPAGAPIKMRGVRYRDGLVREPDGWKIADRVHSVDWEGAVANVPITPIQPQQR